MFKFDQDKFWAGTPASYWAAMDAQTKVAEHLASGNSPVKADGLKDFIDEVAGPVMSVEGNVAVVNVKGSLINGAAGYGRLYGLLGYDDIREALTDAVADRNVKSVLLNVDSSGGQVAGCQELGNYIRDVSAEKPVHTHSDTVMCSAAYWLGVSADKVTSGSTAIVGSIGVLQIHQENSKMMAEAGVTTTVIRSGKYKAIANRFEPLSDLAREEMQSQVDDLDLTFTSYVAERRNVSYENARRTMGQGREFLGAKAVDAGLVDGLSTLSQAHADADLTASKRRNTRQGVASLSPQANNPANTSQGNLMKINLTPEQLAQLQAGAPLASLSLPVADLQALAEQANAAVLAAQQATAKPVEPAAQEPKADTAQGFLRAELHDAYATIGSMRAKLTALEAEAEASKAERASLLQIARASVGNMQVALGGVNAAAALADDAVATEHARVEALYTEKFPVGRVSAAATESKANKPKDNINPLFLAALAQNRNQQN